MATTFEVIFLGTRALIDTTQGNETVENAAGLLGTYGSAGSPLYNSIRTLSANVLTEDDNSTYDTDNGGGYDSFRINGGAAQNFDAVATYFATITYFDGTTATITAVVFQDVNGNTYLAPETSLNTDQAALTLLPIQSLTLTSVESATGDMAADRIAGDFKSPVDGTGGNDSMGPGYTDPQGEAISTGADFIVAGDGNDTINADGGNDTIHGGTGNDLIDDWSGNDLVYGGEGSDTLDLSSGNDTVFMDGGNDLIRVWDNTGVNSLNGGTGTDTLDFVNWQSSVGANIDINAGGAGSFSHFSGATTGTFSGFEAVQGTAFADTLDGGDSNVALTLNGEDGADRISGGSANDSLFGGTGADTVGGGGGNDSLQGGDGNDILSGDFVTPTLVNGDFSGGITGWSGTDTELATESFYLLGASTTNTVAEMDANGGLTTVLQQSFAVTGPGVARLSLDAVQRNVGGLGAVGVDGFTVQILNAGGTVIASTTIQPTSTTTWATFSLDVAFPTAATYTLRLTEVGNNDSIGTIVDNLRFVSATGDDTIDGGAGSDLIDGGAGNDSLVGGADNDTLLGGAGSDILDGGTGNDSLSGGEGNDRFLFSGTWGTDTVAGGNGSDTLDFSGAGGAVSVSYSGTGAGTVTSGANTVDFTGIESLILSSGNDQLYAGADTLGFAVDAGAGNDTMYGGQGADSLFGGDGRDSIYGDAGNDLILGGADNDELGGDAGDDTVRGDAGNDYVQGGTGNDRLSGGEGADTLLGGAGTDTIDGGQVSATGPNLIVNGSFEDTTGMSSNGFWSTGTSAPGWTNSDGFNIEIHADSRNGVVASDGTNWLDLETNPGQHGRIGQTLSGLGTGETYLLRFDVADFANADDGTVNDNGLLVIWNGEVIATIDPPETGMRTFEFLVVAGTGNGANRLEFQGTGAADGMGASVDNVQMYATADGASGADSLQGDGGNDLLLGGDGNDTLNSGQGNDTVSAGAGDDIVTVSDDHGTDHVFGGADYDQLVFATPTSSEGVTVTWTGTGAGTYDFDGTTGAGTFTGIEQSSGTSYADTYDASADTAGTTVYALAGNDTVTGGSGADRLFGGDGDDSLIGDGGNDDIIFGAGNDTVFGGDGDDFFDDAGGTPLGTGSNQIYGGAGNDFSWDGAGNDTFYGGDGNDTFIGDHAGDDQLFGGLGNDSLSGGTGADLLSGGDGTDTLVGGSENDTLFGGADADQLYGGDGVDSLDGGDGDDFLDAGDADDLLAGGAGADILLASWGADTVRGGTGDDILFLGDQDNERDVVVLENGGGTDAILEFEGPVANGDGTYTARDVFDTTLLTNASGGPVTVRQVVVSDDGGGNAVLTFPDGSSVVLDGIAPADVAPLAALQALGFAPTDDIVDGTSGNDTIDAAYTGDPEGDRIDDDAAGDLVRAGDGDDSVSGGAGNDTLLGGAGRDTLDGGAGADTLTGGDGADVFVADGTADVITDFDAVSGVDGGGSADNDFVDLSAFYNATTLAAWNAANPGQTYNQALAWAKADQADGMLDAAGGLQIQGIAADSLTFETVGVVCFAAGTLIDTAKGPVPAEALQPGDLVRTLDNGLQPLRWIGRRHLTAAELDRNHKLRPIRLRGVAVRAEAARDLIVSPQHRVLVSSRIAERMTGHAQVLVPAVKLLSMPGVETATDMAEVTYVHLLFDRHEIIFANGVAAESLYLGAEARQSLGSDSWQEVLTLFPELADEVQVPAPCRPILEGRPARSLADRHGRNARHLQADIPAPSSGSLRSVAA